MPPTTDPTPTPPTIGGDPRPLERPNGYKATQALAILRTITSEAPRLQEELAQFRVKFERENVIEYDRVQAKLRFPPQPIIDEGAPVLHADGSILMLESPVDRLTEQDWAAAGGAYRVPRSPKQEEVWLAMFGAAMEVAEEAVYKLLALFTIGNHALKEARKGEGVPALLARTVEDLLDDAYADELMELAAAVGELIDRHLLRKAKDLGPRLGPFLALLGVEPKPSPSPTSEGSSGNADSTGSTSKDEPSSSRPSSSTDTPASTTGGDPTPSSTPRSTSSSSSGASSEPSTSSESAPAPSSVTTPA